jgi:hypothetical protein
MDWRPFMKRLFNGVKAYLSDWRNWFMHTLVGILIIIIALFAPVSIYLRLNFVVLVVGFNVWRMKYATDIFSRLLKKMRRDPE